MPQFTYTVRDQDGKRHSGIVSAANRADAESILTEKSLLVTRLTTIRAGKNPFLEFFGLGRWRVKGEELLAFTQELAAMLEAGVGLKRAMDILIAEMESPLWRQIALDISSGLSAGQPLSKLMRQYPEVFSNLYLAMVESGEATGNLPETLSRLSDYIEASEEIKRKILISFYYPAVVMGVALTIATLIIVFGIPRLAAIYTSLGQKLPLPTQLLVDFTGGIVQYWYIVFPAIVAFLFLLYQISRRESVQKKLDEMKLKAWIVGPMVRKLGTARFARALSHLYASGIPLLQALQVVTHTMGNRIMEAAIQRCVKNLREGEPIAEALRQSGVFSPLVLGMVSAGDESGTLDRILNKLADFYETQVEIAVRALAGLVEPIVIVFVGLLLGSIIIILGLPFLKVGTLVQ